MKPLSKTYIERLEKRAKLDPASEAALLWTFVWGFVSCGLLWLFSAQAFPTYDNAQGVDLPWVGSLLTLGAIIAALFCYLLYRLRLRSKVTAIAELRDLIEKHRSKRDGVP